MQARIPGRGIAVVLLSAAFLAACEGGVPTDPAPTLSPGFAILPSDNTAEVQHFKVCKVGTDADFTFTVDGGPDQALSLAAGDCASIDQWAGWPPHQISVTELAQPDAMLDSIIVTRILGGGPLSITTTKLTGTSTAMGRIEFEEGYVATYYNTPVSTNGRMTGGGNQLRVDGVRISRGFTIHCDITLSNNVQVNWSGGNRWHLDKPITSAICLDDPNVSPVPPDAPFDTFIGEGVGSLNGVDGSWIHFTFVDAGEPGSSDSAKIQIWAPGDAPGFDTPVLEVEGLLDHGNLQAHEDQPHS